MSPLILSRAPLRLLAICFVSIASIVSISLAARRQNAAGSSLSSAKHSNRTLQLPSAAGLKHAGSTNAQHGPLASGALSFSQPSYSVTEGGGAAITLARAGGAEKQVGVKVGITDVTTSPSDYNALVPGKIDSTFTPTT